MAARSQMAGFTTLFTFYSTVYHQIWILTFLRSTDRIYNQVLLEGM